MTGMKLGSWLALFLHCFLVLLIDSTAVVQLDMAHYSHSLSGMYGQSVPFLWLSVGQETHAQPIKKL